MNQDDVTALLKRLRRKHILKAIAERNRIGKGAFRKLYGFGAAKTYFLVHEHERYDSKAIVGVACQFLRSSGPLTAADIYGGRSMKAILEALGFEVVIEPLGSLIVRANSADAAPFDPSDLVDARDRVRRTIVQRRGQQHFRDVLLLAYEGQCAITGSTAIDVLEAAHISPYLGPETNHVTNGLLLRADIHTLFDLGLILISPIDTRISVDGRLVDREYRKFHGKKLRAPKNDADSPSISALFTRQGDERL